MKIFKRVFNRKLNKDHINHQIQENTKQIDIIIKEIEFVEFGIEAINQKLTDLITKLHYCSYGYAKMIKIKVAALFKQREIKESRLEILYERQLALVADIESQRDKQNNALKKIKLKNLYNQNIKCCNKHSMQIQNQIDLEQSMLSHIMDTNDVNQSYNVSSSEFNSFNDEKDLETFINESIEDLNRLRLDLKK